MKKVAVASLLVCAAALVPAFRPAVAQQQVSLGSGGAAQPCQMPDAEYKPYNDAVTQTDPKAKAAAIEAYLQAFPKSSCPNVTQDTLVLLMATYSQVGDAQKTLDTADRILQLDPNNLRALYGEAVIRKSLADAQTDATAKQAGYDQAASYAQKALAAFGGSKPANMSDADFNQLKTAATPTMYSIIASAALNKKDAQTAIDNYKKELASVPVDQTTKPGPVLQDTYFLATAYLATNPPDYLSCAYYAARFVAYAPEPYKTQYAPTAQYCYKKYHGSADGYDALATASQASIDEPANLKDTIKPAPTPAEQIHTIIASTPDLSTLAVSDKEMVFQYGSPDDAAKVWDTIKGKSVEIPGALVISSTPDQLKVAVSDDAKQSKTADFTVNLAPAEEGKTAAEKAAAKKKADAIAAATAPGQTITFSGTYDSFTPNPLMITMTNGDVVLAKAKPAAHAPVHHTTHK